MTTDAYAQVSGNSLANSIGDIFGNFTKGFNSISKQFGYTVILDGNRIFPNKTLKENIVSKYEPSTYNLNDLKYKLFGLQHNRIKYHNQH